MRAAEGRHFTPDTINTMQIELDVAWNCLSKKQRQYTAKSLLASRILDAAAAGEADPSRLVIAALAELTDP